MRIFYWALALLAATSIWIASLILLTGLIIDPIYDQRVELLSNSVGVPSIGKGDFLKVEVERNSALKRLGALGGVVFGFVFGAIAVVSEKHLLKRKSEPDRT